MTYIATFYSHFGAIRYKRLCESCRMAAKLMPVPRDLSSSCGTCVRCEGDYLPPADAGLEEIEQVATWDGTGYTTVYHTDETED